MKNIKLMNKTMPIHSARELKISVEEIKVLLNGEKESIRLLDIDCYETSKNKRAHLCKR